MKIGKNKLRMSNGSIRTFKSQAARDSFERVAKAVKHGFVPDKGKKGSTSMAKAKTKPKKTKKKKVATGY